MRAVLVGLVGAVLLAGGAQAKKASSDAAPIQCSVSDRVFTVGRAEEIPTERVTSAELVGQQAHVVRTAAAGRWAALEVEVASRRFTIRYDVTPHAVPAVMASSYAGAQAKGVNWKRQGDPSLVSTAAIYDGPLAGLSLGEGACK